MRIRQAGVVAAAVATAAGLLGLAAMAQASTAQASTPTGWRLAYSKHYGPSKSYSAYQQAVAFSATNAWVFGSADGSRVTSERLVALHWNGRVWSNVTLPAKATTNVTALDAPAAHDIWLGTLFGQAVHWNGAKWVVTELPQWARYELTGVTALSPTNVWVFGGNGGADPGVGTWHFNGKTWTEWKTGAATGIESASAVSRSSIWAIGSNSLGGGIDTVDHFNGKAWQTVSAKALDNLQLLDVQAFSDHDVWVEAFAGLLRSNILLHYNGKTWSRVPAPKGEQVVQIASIDSRGGLWIVAGSTTKPYILHRTATGSAWTTIPYPLSNLESVAPVPGDSGLWASGYVQTASGGATAQIWAYGKV